MSIVKVPVFYSRIGRQFAPEVFDACIGRLPAIFQEKIRRLRRWQDAQASLLGKMLLGECLRARGYDGESFLRRLTVDAFGKPRIEGEAMDFSISHSGDVVVCALGESVRIGIDLEKVGIPDMTVLDAFCGPAWKAAILAADDPRRAFYRFWTKVESIFKADGQGLGASPADIAFQEGGAVFRGIRWYVREIGIDSGYACSMAISKDVEAEIEHVPRTAYRGGVPLP